MQSYKNGRPFVGFYWTYPLKSFGFTQLSTNAVEAAGQSKTIRYQRELIHRHVEKEKGHLIDEVVFLEVAQDYGTEAVLDPLTRRAHQHCVLGEATLLWVDFAYSVGWRPHRHLHRCLFQMKMRNERVKAIDWSLDGEMFKPAEHFEKRHAQEEEHWNALKAKIPSELAEAMSQVPEGYGRYPKIADYLNQKGVRSKTGALWTPDNVRMAIKDFTLGSEQDEG